MNTILHHRFAALDLHRRSSSRGLSPSAPVVTLAPGADRSGGGRRRPPTRMTPASSPMRRKRSRRCSTTRPRRSTPSKAALAADDFDGVGEAARARCREAQGERKA